MKFEALSRNDHLEDFRQNRVHVVCRFSRAKDLRVGARRRRDQRASRRENRCWAHPSESLH